MELRRSRRRLRQRRRLRPRQSRLGKRIEKFRATRIERTSPPPLPPRVAFPSFFTLLNLFCGFLSIIQISDGRMTYAAWLIVLAGFFDLLDGMMARLAGATSEFGIQLDSLADIVSFGVAPSFLVFRNGLNEFGALGIMVAALPAICGAVRLARFNVTASDEKKDYFNGLPIPAQAAALVAFILTFNDPSWFTSFASGKLSIIIPLVVVLSTLMVTNIRFEALPQPTRGYVKSHKLQVIFFCVAVVLVLFFQETGLFITLLLYIMFAILRSVVATTRAIMEPDSS